MRATSFSVDWTLLLLLKCTIATKWHIARFRCITNYEPLLGLVSPLTFSFPTMQDILILSQRTQVLWSS
uniref:Putative secreted protein n=1 Tax=Anopheles darlingi TaxID=43151 RepID=A0A2M4DL10_ANODA